MICNGGRTLAQDVWGVGAKIVKKSPVAYSGTPVCKKSSHDIQVGTSSHSFYHRCTRGGTFLYTTPPYFCSVFYCGQRNRHFSTQPSSAWWDKADKILNRRARNQSKKHHSSLLRVLQFLCIFDNCFFCAPSIYFFIVYRSANYIFHCPHISVIDQYWPITSLNRYFGQAPFLLTRHNELATKCNANSIRETRL